MKYPFKPSLSKSGDDGLRGIKGSFKLILAGVLFAGVLASGCSSSRAGELDYSPESGEPKCANCHTPDKRYSVDYTRDETCAQCHSPGLSDKYLEINDRYAASQDGGGTGAGNIHGGNLVIAKNNAAPADKKSEIKARLNARPAKSMRELKSMVLIPKGEFTMGSNDWWPKSQPEHRRSLPAFYIDKYEVTNARYKAFVDATGHSAPDHWAGGVIPRGRQDHPVLFVTWYDADEFCKWEGKRLPTEAEWEKAARGADKRAFPWGDKFSKDRANTPQLGLEDTVPVGGFEDGKSPYGVYDMAGNAWEWTADWFKPYPGNTHHDENYGEKYKVLRGGSWYDCTYYKCGISSPSYNKIFFHARTKNNNFGFRCARDKQ